MSAVLTPRVPSIFVSIGESDCWDPTTISNTSQIIVDSRMRRLNVINISGTGPSILARTKRKASIVPKYAESIQVNTTNSGASQFGLFRVGATFTNTSNISTQTGSVVFARGGGISQDGSTIETVTAWSDGEVIGVELYSDAMGQDYAQFYRDGNPAGDPVTLSTSGSQWRLAASMADTADREQYLLVDWDELIYIQSGVQPWGAAAQVADVGGYSPAAPQIEDAGSGILVWPNKRVAESTTTTSNSAVLGGNSHTENGLFICSWRIVRNPASGGTQMVGLVRRGTTMTGDVGSTADGWAYTEAGQLRNNGSSSGALATFTTGDILAAAWNPSTGKLWFMKNWLLIGGGSLVTQTGEDFTGVTGDIVPACTPGGTGANDGIIEFRVHKFEMIALDDRLTPWMGAPLLPERFYTSDLARDTEIEQSIWFPTPWGGSRRNDRPIGLITLQNTAQSELAQQIGNEERRYTAMTRYDLRDRDVRIFEIERPETTSVPADEIRWVARGTIERVDVVDEDTVTVATRGRDSMLDTPVPGDRYTFGGPQHLPVYPEGNTADRYLVTDNQAVGNAVFDQGLDVSASTTAYGSGPYGFTRTTPATGKQTANTPLFSVGLQNAQDTAQAILALSGFGYASTDYDVSGVPDTVSFDYYSTNRETYADVLGKLLEGCITSIAQRDDGKIFFVPMVSVPGATADYTLTNVQRFGQCRIRQDLAPKLTNGQTDYRITSPYRADELAGAVSEANKLILTRPYDETRETTITLHPFYSFATGAPPLPLYTRHDASDTTQLEAMLTNYQQLMQFVDQSYKIADVRPIRVGDIVAPEINFIPNFTKAMVIRRVRRLLSPVVDLTFWGRA